MGCKGGSTSWFGRQEACGGGHFPLTIDSSGAYFSGSLKSGAWMISGKVTPNVSKHRNEKGLLHESMTFGKLFATSDSSIQAAVQPHIELFSFG